MLFASRTDRRVSVSLTAKRSVIAGSLLLVPFVYSSVAHAQAKPIFLNAPQDTRPSPAKVSAEDLSVQFDTPANAHRAARARGAKFVFLKHISEFKGYACGYFEYSTAAQSGEELLKRKTEILSAPGAHKVEYVFRTVLAGMADKVQTLAEPLADSTLSSIIPNDEKFKELWGMKKISAPKAWQTHTDASNIVLFLTDSGINLKNDDIKENLWTNSKEIPGNKKDDDNNGYVDDIHGIDSSSGSGNPQDRIGHGSHCACTIAGRGNNRFGVAGVAWKLQIASCKAFSNDGTGKSSWQTKCFEYMIDLKKRGEKITVTSNSWGAKGDDPNIKAAFEAASSLGMIHAVAAGNYGDDNDRPSDAIYPASYDLDSIISVIWTNKDDSKNGSSNYGRKTTDLAAPGTQIYSCHGTKNGHYFSSGTSMATPHVGGALALMSSYARAADAAKLRKVLLDGVDKVSSLRSYTATGGRLNIAKSLAALEPSEEPEEEGTSTGGEEETGTEGTSSGSTTGEESSTGESSTGEDDTGTEDTDSQGDDSTKDSDGPDDKTRDPEEDEDDSTSDEKEDDDDENGESEGDEDEDEDEDEDGDEDEDEDGDEDGDDDEDEDENQDPGTASKDPPKGGCGCQSSSPLSSTLFGGFFMLSLGLFRRRSSREVS